MAKETGETLPARRGVRGFLLVGHEKVPHGFGLTRDRGGNTADGARAERLLNCGLQLVFLRYGTQDWARGRRKNYVCLWIF